jgi:hypothetical protein
VQPGERVAAGETLGYVGRIGTSSVPVLAFGVLRNDTAVDPFRPDGTGACGDVTGTRWQPEALVALRYQPAGVVASGFAAEPVDLKKAIAGGYAQEPGRDAPVLGFWVMSYGVRAGDREVLAIVGPDGRTLAEGTLPAERNSVDRAVRVQRPRGDTPWAPGTYRGTYRLVRDGQVVTEHARVLEVR